MNDPEQAAEVLPNLRGFTDPAELAEYERRVAYLRVEQIEHDPSVVEGDFDFAHLQRIHQYILQDVYAWAGELRHAGQDTTAFGMVHCRPEFLPDEIRRVFGAIDRQRPSTTDRQQAIATVAEHWGETSALHPFLDGNSRSQRVFFHRYLQASGWDIDWRRVDAATVHAARHVAMRTVDSSYLAAALEPGVHQAGRSEPGSLTRSLGARDDRASLDIYQAMLEHKRNGGTAATFHYTNPSSVEIAARGPVSPRTITGQATLPDTEERPVAAAAAHESAPPRPGRSQAGRTHSIGSVGRS